MYNLDNIRMNAPVSHYVPLKKRIKLIQDSLHENKKIIILLYEQEDWSTFRYRCYNIYQISQKSDTWQCIYFFKNIKEETDAVMKYIPSASIIVFVRCQWNIHIDSIACRAKEHNVTILYDTDDLIFDLFYIKTLVNTVGGNLNVHEICEYWFSYISRNGYTASMADGFIATNKFLADKLVEKYGKPCGIIPNSINDEQMFVSCQCLEKKERAEYTKLFTLGYFSGSPSHMNDLGVILPEIVDFLNDFSDVRLLVVGFMDFPSSCRSLIDNKRIIQYPLTDFVTLQNHIAEVDINLVPLVVNEFTNCKSELKFFEAAIVKTPTIASKIYTYKNAIEHSVNGFLCGPGEWYDTIRGIYEGKYDIQKIINNAYEYSVNKYYGINFLKSVEDCFDRLIGENIE